jgi:hypothetical protein
VKLRMDFRDANIVGTFVYHCHILDHEDLGMMGEIQVLPPQISTTTAVAAGATTVNVNSNVTVIASVTPANSGNLPPAGSVQFAVDGVSSGRPINVSGGQAQFTTVFTTGGTHTVTATYSGDESYSGSQSSPLVITVSGFTLAARGALELHAGQTANTIVTVTPAGGFNAVVNLACSMPGTLQEASCSVNPGFVVGGGQVILTVSTTGAHALNRGGSFFWSSSSFGVMLACIMLIVRPARRRQFQIVSRFLLACLMAGVGCGGSVRDSGTVSGNYIVTVTGTSGSGATRIQSSVDIACAIQ